MLHLITSSSLVGVMPDRPSWAIAVAVLQDVLALLRTLYALVLIDENPVFLRYFEVDLRLAF